MIPHPFLLCRVRTHWCALLLTQVVETMRLLPIEPLANTPSFVLGLSVIRGDPVPVVDAARLLGAKAGVGTRLITLRTDTRQVALAVDEVIGVRTIPNDELHSLPPLLHGSCTATVTAIGTLDAALLLVLTSARLVPEDVWVRLEKQVAP